MDSRARDIRRLGIGATAFILAAVLARILTLPLEPFLRGVEAGIGLLTVGFIVAAFRLSRTAWPGRGPMLVLYAITPALLASLGLRLAAAYVPDYPLFATLVFAALLLGIDAVGSRATTVVAALAVLAVFGELWVTTLPIEATSLESLGVAAAVLAGIVLLMLLQTARVRRGLDADTMRGQVFATVSRRLGTERDLASVASSMLAVCRDLYPQANYGGILLLDETDGFLKPAGVHLGPDGIVQQTPPIELAPGEGLAGAAYQSSEPLLWSNAVDVSTAQTTLHEQNRARLRQARSGFARSAIAAPMRLPESGTVGALVLTCHRREDAWSARDLPTIQALADEAARALERARQHAADVDRALLDSITGLVTHRQLVTVVDKEVSRAARANGTLAVIFSDLDDFKQVNDAWGHDAGNRVLRMFADVLRGTLRREDTAARYGGDEFVCVLPGADRAQALAIADRLQQRFSAAAAGDPVVAPSSASVSSGVAMFPLDAQTAEALLTAADAELLRAKQRRAGERALTGRTQRRAGGAAQPLDAHGG